MEPRVVRGGPDSPFEASDRVLVCALLVGDQSPHVERVGVAGRAFEDFAIERLGAVEIAGPVALHRGFERSRRRPHRRLAPPLRTLRAAQCSAC